MAPTITLPARRKSELMPELMDLLKQAGVPEAANAIGMDFDQVFAPLAANSLHPYRNYHWSVSYSESGGPLIQSLPPEEEMGWIPWEEWFTMNGKPVRRSMVLFPVKQATRNVPLWWCLEQSESQLSPRYADQAKTLEELFHSLRIFEASEAVGFDAQKIIIDPLSTKVSEIYLQMRWSVAPHRLAADLPVIQCLPPRDHSHYWPWETWYTDGKNPLIHHVHYSHPNPRTGSIPWNEREGAPQRPKELFGLEWYWYNDESMTPALMQDVSFIQ